jgi:drug/metabolite transporter (DMT)-like permease
MKLSMMSDMRYRVDAMRNHFSKSPHVQAVLSCLSYASCSVLLTLANKAIFSERKLNYPWTLLGVQSIFCAIMLGAYYGVTARRSPVKPVLLRELLFPCIIFACYIYSNARALRYISLPMLSVVKSLAPMGIALSELFLFREHVSGGTYGAMGLILLSNAVTVTNDIEFSPAGYMWATANAIANIAYVVSLRYCLSNTYSSGEKTLHMNLLLTAIMFPVALVMGELGGFFHEFSETSVRFRILFTMSCFLAAGIGASVFWVIQATSGSTLSFVGGANKVLVITLGAVLFNAKISVAGWIGVLLGVLASISFTVAKARASTVKSSSKNTTSSMHLIRKKPDVRETKVDNAGEYLVHETMPSVSDVSDFGDGEDPAEGDTNMFRSPRT